MNAIKAGASSAVVVVGLLLSACGAGRTLVMEPPDERRTFPAATIERGKDNVPIPEEYATQLVQKLREGLYGNAEKPGAFADGAGLTIRTKVVQFEAGSKFQRWFWGGIGNQGEGSLHLLAEFYDGDRKLAQIQTEGRIDSGAFGGSLKSAVEKAAEEITEYAVANFR